MTMCGILEDNLKILHKQRWVGCNPEPGEGMEFTSRVSEEELMDTASGSNRCGGFKWDGQ